MGKLGNVLLHECGNCTRPQSVQRSRRATWREMHPGAQKSFIENLPSSFPDGTVSATRANHSHKPTAQLVLRALSPSFVYLLRTSSLLYLPLAHLIPEIDSHPLAVHFGCSHAHPHHQRKRPLYRYSPQKRRTQSTGALHTSMIAQTSDEGHTIHRRTANTLDALQHTPSFHR